MRYYVLLFFKPLSFGVVCYAADDLMQHKTPAGLGGSEHRTPREWKSGAKQHCLMNSWGELRDIIKHRGRWHQWHRKSWSERTASSGYDCTWGVLYSRMHPEKHKWGAEVWPKLDRISNHSQTVQVTLLKVHRLLPREY